MAGKEAAGAGSQGADHEQKEHRAGVWGHTGLETEGGDGEEDGRLAAALQWLGLDKPPQHRVRHKVWRKQLVDSTRQLKLGADRARQRTEMEMLDGTEVVSVVGASGAEPVAEGGVWIGADAESAAEAGDGHLADAMGGEDDERMWEEWDSGDWVEGTGIDSKAGTGAEAAAAEVVVGAAEVGTSGLLKETSEKVSLDLLSN